MRPFRMFFGLSVAIILFMFLARVAFVAFIAAAVMSIGYAVFRRVKDFITYDRYGEPYFKKHHYQPQIEKSRSSAIEPLFNESVPQYRKATNKVPIY